MLDLNKNLEVLLLDTRKLEIHRAMIVLSEHQVLSAAASGMMLNMIEAIEEEIIKLKED